LSCLVYIIALFVFKDTPPTPQEGFTLLTIDLKNTSYLKTHILRVEKVSYYNPIISNGIGKGKLRVKKLDITY